MKSNYPRRGEIYWVTLDPTLGSEIQKTRPAVIVSNNAGNEFLNRVIVAPITSNIKQLFPFEVPITINEKSGKILLDQIRAVDKIRLGKRISSCTLSEIDLIDEAIKIALGLK